ncbi:MAG TPA: M48 family metallopeptidase [Candidatus Paceibacterota bacterium]|nr:M48 family metallopeptidase [Candidatus Paceibacterota bacterium]
MRRGTRHHYEKYKEAASAHVHARLAHFNQFYGLSYRRVFIKNLRSRWGSCSEHANLNFNYKIIFLPPEVADYVILHELCHLAEFNHGPKFWALVEQGMPDYRRHRAALNRIR